MFARLSFEYEFTDDLAIRATPLGGLNAKFLRVVPPVLLLLVAWASLIALDKLLEMPATALDGIPEIMTILFGGILVLMSFLQVLALVALRLTRRRLRNWAASLRGSKIRWTFSDDSFSVHTSDSDTLMPWGEVRKLRTGADFWILRIKDGTGLMLPVEYLSDEIREMILARTASLAECSESSPRTEH